MSVLNKLIEMVTCALNGKKIPHKLTSDEYEELTMLLHEFEYLYCYPYNNYFYNYKVIKKAFHENKFFMKKYYEGTKAYERLLKNDNIRESIEKNGFYCEERTDDESSVAISYHKALYEKEEDGIGLYSYFVENPNRHFKYRIPYPIYKNSKMRYIEIADCLIPVEIKGQEREEMINSEYCISASDNTYRFKISHPTFSTKLKINQSNIINNLHVALPIFKTKLLNNESIEYVDIDGVLVFAPIYKYGEYKLTNDAREKQTKFLVVDENGQEIPNDKLPAAEVLYDIRNAIAHCKVYDYNVVCEAGARVEGRVYISVRKEKKNNEIIEIKRAVICPKIMLETLLDGYCFNLDPNNSVYCYIFSPTIDEKLTSSEQIGEYQKRCKIVVVKIEKTLDEAMLSELMKDIFDDFRREQCDSLKEFVTERLSKKFKSVKVTITDIANEKWLNQMFEKNDVFLSLPFKGSKVDQMDYADDVCRTYFKAQALTASWMQANENDVQLHMLPLGVNAIISNMIKFLAHYSEEKTETSDGDFKCFEAFKSQLYYVLCMVVAYANIVKNSFRENLNYKNFKMELSTMDSFERKMETEDMRNFEHYKVIKKFDGKGNSPKTPKNKVDVIRYIRNAICHARTYIKYNNSGKCEENYIIFYSKNKKQNIPDNIVRVQCKDFLEFCMRPVFTNYNTGEKQGFKEATFDNLIQRVGEVLKESC